MTSLALPRRARGGWAIAASVALLIISNVVANRLLAAWAVIPWNLAVSAVLLIIARRVGGRSWADLGLARSAVPSGARWGLAGAAAILALYILGAVLPVTHALFEDSRVDRSIIGVLAQAFLWVPLGTVILEEVAFRGVLPALFASRVSRRRADLLSAVLFGLWHVLPAWSINTANPVFREVLPGTPGQITAIALGVLGTAFAGLILSWLRNRSGSLLAPILVHMSTNGFGYLVGWVVQRSG